MGNVWRAHDVQTGETVAIKLLDGEASELAHARFRHEIDTLAQLRAPGIVEYLGHGVADTGQPFVVMEWIDGEDLASRLLRGVLEIDELLALLRATAAALCVAHRRGIVHRDLKPSNLMLRHGRIDQPVLIDFGVARHTMPSTLTRTGTLIGTPVYMAPEQARGDRELPLSADVFSLGCVAFQCLAGQPPFAADHIAAVLARILFEDAPAIASLRADVPDGLADLLARMLARDAGRRPADAEQLYAELLRMPDGGPRTMVEHVDARPSFEQGFEQQLFSVLVAIPSDAAEQIYATLADDDHTIDVRFGEPVALALTMGGQAQRLLDGTVVVVFAAQTSVGDRAMLAARCAFELRRRWPSFAVALTTGHGRVHGQQAFGEAVERAHRLLAGADPAALRLDELTAELLDARFEIAVDDDGVHTLIGVLAGDGGPRQLLGKPLPCLGRAHELGVLELTLRSCIDARKAELVVVTGEPGCGKSRLRHEFVRRSCAPRRELLLLQGDGDPMTTGTPHAILGRALEHAAGIARGQDVATRRRAIDELVASFELSPPCETAAFLGVLCGIEPIEDGSAALRAALQDPALMRERCVAAWIALLRQALARGPVVVVVDDLQWSDRPTLETLLHTHALLADAPLVVLLLARDDSDVRFPDLRRALERAANRRHMHLGGLSRSACERIIHESLGDAHELSDTLVERLVVQASGNALYLEELIRAVARGGVDDVPKSVGAMLQARMEQLDRVARRVLLAASVLGQHCEPTLLPALLATLEPASVQLAIERLIAAELLERDGAGLRFRHMLLRDTAYQLLAPEAARELHRLVAEQLIERGDSNPARIADHLAAAGRGERAASFYLRAAEQASAANALEEALALAEKGLACPPSGEIAVQLAAIETWALGWLGRWTTIVELAEATLARLPPGGAWWSRCLAMLIGVGLLTGDERLLARTTTQLFAAAPQPKALIQYLDALNVGIGTGTTIGRYQLAARFHQRAVEVAGQATLDDDARRLLAFADAAVGSTVGLDPERALRAAETALALAQTVGDGRYRVFSQVVAGQCHARLGRVAHALALVREALAVAQGLANPYLRTYATAVLASMLASLDDEAARDEVMTLTAALLDAPAIPPPFPGWAKAVRGQVLLARGQPHAAARELGDALLALAGTPCLLTRAWLTRAEVADALGQADEGREAIDAALDIIEPEGGWESLLALRARARAGSSQARTRLAAELARVLERVHEHPARAALTAAFSLP
jgi:tetratricopeptide (TPR) repeat protein